ncbi:MAG: DUF4381 family protein [Xanthomonadales bacterium]|nr:DUF4381 family protein [Xanthomonadales bacterium]
MDPQQLDLRDIHGAPLPPWWPPAPGWWILAALLLVMIVVALVFYRRRLARLRLQRRLQAEFQDIIERAGGDASTLNSRLAEYFRRLVVHRGGAADMAGKTGQAWASFLATPLAQDAAVAEMAARLVDSPYRPAAPPLDVAAAQRLANCWIEQVTRA